MVEVGLDAIAVELVREHLGAASRAGIDDGCALNTAEDMRHSLHLVVGVAHYV